MLVDNPSDDEDRDDKGKVRFEGNDSIKVEGDDNIKIEGEEDAEFENEEYNNQDDQVRWRKSTKSWTTRLLRTWTIKTRMMRMIRVVFIRFVKWCVEGVGDNGGVAGARVLT